MKMLSYTYVQSHEINRLNTLVLICKILRALRYTPVISLTVIMMTKMMLAMATTATRAVMMKMPMM